MANLIINEFVGIGARYAAPIPAAAVLNATQVVAIGVGSAQSAATEEGTNLVRVHAEASCSILIGPDPTASLSTSIPLAAGQTDYFVVTPGHKVAVIERTVS